MTEIAPRPFDRNWPDRLLVFVLALATYAMAGHEGRLFHDDAIFFYGGQEMVRGVPVYVGVFDHKGPLGQMICGLGVWLSQSLGTDDLATTRALFLGVAAATATLVHALALTLFRDRVQAFVTAAVFVSFWGFGALAYSGTRPKMLMTLFEALTLVAATNRRWFLTGVVSTLAAFTWQPTGLLFVVALVIAALRGDRDGRKGKAVLHLVLGAAVPTVAMVSYFAWAGAIGPFLDGCFRFNAQFLENPRGVRAQLASMMTIFVYNGMGIPTVAGLCAILVLYRWRLRDNLHGFWNDRFSYLLATFPFPVAWSLFDFQQYPDFFIFLPYVAIGTGWVVTSAARGVAERVGVEAARRSTWAIGAGLFLFAFSAAAYRFGRDTRLVEQRAQAAEFVERYGDARIAVVGVPEALCLLRRTNVTPYAFIMRGIAHYIDATEDGGFAGWLAGIRASDAELLIVDESYPERLGALADEWTTWLAGYEPLPKVGSWSVFRPRAISDGEAGDADAGAR